MSAEQMQAAIVSLLLRTYWLTVHLVAHDGVIEPIAKRQVDYEDYLHNAAGNVKDWMEQELMSLGLDEAFVRHLLAEGHAGILREFDQRPPS